MSAVAEERGDNIASLIDGFCNKHLNEEYRVACRELLAVVEGLSYSPLATGAAEAWAAGIVRTIGWVNYLDGEWQRPSMKLLDIDRLPGVSPGVGGVKSRIIRETLKIHEFSPRWTLPSKMKDNPVIWTIELPNGKSADVRLLQRAVQVDAGFDSVCACGPQEGLREGGERRTTGRGR